MTDTEHEQLRLALLRLFQRFQLWGAGKEFTATPLWDEQPDGHSLKGRVEVTQGGPPLNVNVVGILPYSVRLSNDANHVIGTFNADRIDDMLEAIANQFRLRVD